MANSVSFGRRGRAVDRSLGLLVVLLAALVFAGAASAAGTSQSVVRPPSFFWTKIPLVPASYRTHAVATGPLPALPLRAEPGGYGLPSSTLLFLLLGSLTVAVWGVRLVRSALGQASDEAARARLRPQDEQEPEQN